VAQKDPAHVEISGGKIMLKTFSGGKELNIMNHVRSFDIFESLDNYTITADFYIAEGIELINEFPLGGEETIELTIQTPGKAAATYKFFVESIQGMKTNDTSMLRSYKLSCCTKDFLKNSCTVYSKRYKDLKYHEALSTIINTDLGAEESLQTIEQTKGKFDYVCNNVRPFQIIDLIKERAVSAEGNQSSVFVFYQDNKGYHFQTIEKLIKDRKGGAEGKKFKYESGNRALPYENARQYRNILSYENVTQGSAVRKVTAGAMKNEIREFDFHRGTYYQKEEYINLAHHKAFEATDDKEDFNSADYNSFTSKLPGITRLAIKDATRPEMEHNKNIHWQRAFRERMFQNVVRIRVYGDTSIRVGDIVKLEFPEISGITRAPKQNKIFSENYIVTNLKHRADQKRNGIFEHFCIMDVAKPNQFTRPLG